MCWLGISLGPCCMCPKDAVKFSQGISQTKLQPGGVIPGLGLGRYCREELYQDREPLFILSHLMAWFLVRSEDRCGHSLDLWQMSFCSLVCFSVAMGLITEICEGLFGNFNKEFDIRMRWMQWLGHYSSTQADLTDVNNIPTLGEGKWYHVCYW